MKTRSKKITSKIEEVTDEQQPELVEQTPPTLTILPKDLSPNARIFSLRNPCTGNLSRYLFCPKKGLYEFTKIKAPFTDPRSILLARPHSTENNISTDQNEQTATISAGFVAKDAEFIVATPIAPLLLVLPILRVPGTTSAKSQGEQGLLRSLDDLFDTCPEYSTHLRNVLEDKQFFSRLESQLAIVCDVVEVEGQNMYRLSDEKLLKRLLLIAERVVKKGIPQSMEDKFIQRALETPVLAVKRENTTVSFASEVTTPSTDETSSKVDSVTSTSISTTTDAADIEYLMRLRTVLNFLTSSYISSDLVANLEVLLSSPAIPIDFSPLEKHLKRLADMRAEAHNSRTFSNISRKRLLDAEEAAERRAEKRYKEEEEEKKRRAQESRGVKALKKINTKGMKSLDFFFKKS